MIRTFGLTLAFVVAAAGVGVDDVLKEQNLVFNPGKLAPGTPTTWTFRTATENAIARVRIDSEGTEIGAVPDGYAELQLRAQDELRDERRQVMSSSDMTAHLRVMSHSFGYTTDPRTGNCRGTQCPDMFEMVSARDLRLTSSGNGTVDVVVGGTPLGEIGRRLIIDKDGVTWPDLKAEPRRRNFACFDDTGKFVSQPTPCDE